MFDNTVNPAPVRRRTAAMTAVAALAVSLTVTAPAEAADYVGTANLRNIETGLCLDSDFNGAVYARGCSARNTNDHQLWQPILLIRGNGVPGSNLQYDLVALKNKATKRCLALTGSNTLRTTLDCEEDAQEWSAQGLGWNDVLFWKWSGSTRYAVDGNRSGSVYAHPWNGGRYQRWNFDA
uniref:RICIN domain-containing protein n=1 Tax=Herbidospora sakaeratensis TaxID=564415 RepID=UPI0007857501|nr:hypothetical protein [Herbidospora sakaeratensis]